MKIFKMITMAYIALFAMGFYTSAQSQILAAEYDFHKFQGRDQSSHYWAVGLIQPTKYGTFDGWLQGSRNYSAGFSKDRLQGWELGYGYTLPVAGDLTFTPRLAYGAMNNIDFGGGAEGNARYWLLSGEAALPIREGLGLFIGASHTFGANADAIQSWNRFMTGVDVSLTKKISLRLGVSHIRQLQLNQRGVYGIISYNLGE
jgi:hypothetical protein